MDNTWGLYNFTGGGLDSFIQQLESWGYTVEEGSYEIIEEYAALQCLKKNAFKAENRSEGGTQATLPVIDKDEVKWYLPASDQFQNINDAEHPLSGEYWTSTAVINSNTNSYKYTVGSGVSEENRTSELNIRAVRKAN